MAVVRFALRGRSYLPTVRPPRPSPTASTAGAALSASLTTAVCMSNNAAERALRCVAVGRHNWTFAGSDGGGRRAAAIYTLGETCKVNGVDPRAWPARLPARQPGARPA